MYEVQQTLYMDSWLMATHLPYIWHSHSVQFNLNSFIIIIAERLSTRQLIPHHISEIVCMLYVCMYVCMYVYVTLRNAIISGCQCLRMLLLPL